LDKIKILTASERSVKAVTFMSNRIASDIDLAVRQLRYVARTKELDYINEGQNEAEKLERFEQFWQELDPTPHTKRNEAMEEYYQRIDFANKNFKSYAEGWLTDKGQVFIIYGMPTNVEQTNKSQSDLRTFEEWTYMNNRIFVFLDISGFGTNFRLYSPSMISDKYIYEN
jgi:GWxTD domain-containing protein